MIEVLLVLILLTLVVMARGLYAINDNVYNRNMKAKHEHAELCVAFRMVQVRQDEVTEAVKNHTRLQFPSAKRVR